MATVKELKEMLATCDENDLVQINLVSPQFSINVVKPEAVEVQVKDGE